MDEYRWEANEPLETLLGFLIGWIENFLAPNHLSAVGHRMLHGGTLYDEPIIVTPEILENSFGFNRFSYIIAILSCVKWKFYK